MAENTHELWADNRIKDGWSYGPARDDLNKQTPCLVPYSALPESERDYDRKIVIGTLKLIIKLNYTISRNNFIDGS